MSYMPVGGYALQTMTQQGEVANGYYLKFYEANTTTPLSMATDSTGATTLVKAKLNDNGMPISNPLDNTTVFVPFVNQDYRLVIYTNEADADNNTTASAFVNIPSIPLVAYEKELTSNRYYMTYGGIANAIALTSVNKSPNTAYEEGMEFRFTATNTNTGSVTINVDGLGAKTCKKADGTDVTSGYISTDTETLCHYDGTNFVIHPPLKEAEDTKNGFINGDLQIWQRGTSGFVSGYSADMLRIQSGASDVSRTTLNIPTSSKYGAKITRSLTGSVIVGQRMEASLSTNYVGKKATVSFYNEVVSGQLDDIDVSIYYANSEDDFSGTTLIETVNLSSPNDGDRNHVTFAAIPANAANGIEVRFSYNVTGSTAISLAEYKIEKGDTATEFEYISPADQLARCIRYFERFAGGTSSRNSLGSGHSESSTTITTSLKYSEKRAIPSITSSGNAGDFNARTTTPSDVACSFTTEFDVGIKSCSIQFTRDSGTHTSNDGFLLSINSGADNFIDISAVL